MNLFDEHMALFDDLRANQETRTDGCACAATMTNAGTHGMFAGYDSQGCPLHCNHIGINTDGEWWCGCGASHVWEGQND